MPDDNKSDTSQNDTGAVISDHTTATQPSSPPVNNAVQSGQATQEPNQVNENMPKVSGGENMSMEVLSDTDEGKKSNNKKIIATIFGVLFLVGGVAAGVFLVQRQQNLQEKAASGADCSHAVGECVLFENPGNTGSDSVPKNIKYLDITAKDYHRYTPGNTDDGCYRVSIQGREFTWQRVGDGPDCKDISNIQVWMGEEETPSLSASCSQIMAYDESWNPLSLNQLEQLESGQTIKLAVEGTSDNGTVDKARFRINSSEWLESTNLKPGEASTYFINYTIPEDTDNFTINAQVHLSENDNWY